MVESYQVRDRFVKRLNEVIKKLSSGLDHKSMLNEVILAASEYDKAIIDRMEEIEADNVELSIQNNDMRKRWEELTTKLGLMGINYEIVLLVDYKKAMADRYLKRTKTNFTELKNAIKQHDIEKIASCTMA